MISSEPKALLLYKRAQACEGYERSAGFGRRLLLRWCTAKRSGDEYQNKVFNKIHCTPKSLSEIILKL